MPKYLITGGYSVDGIKGVMSEGGTGRRDAITKLATSVGGKVESLYFAFGSDDVYIIVDLPSNEAAAAVAMTVATSGSFSPRTVVLMSPEEVDAATKLSPTYRPPGR